MGTENAIHGLLSGGVERESLTWSTWDSGGSTSHAVCPFWRFSAAIDADMSSLFGDPIEVVHFVSVTGSLYEKLALRTGAGDGTEHERVATVFEVVRGHGAVLTKLRLSRERWILWVEVDHLRLGGTEKYRGRQLQFVTLEDGTSVIGECRSNRFLDERCRFSPEQEDELRALGWKDPEPPWTPNWHFEASSDDGRHTLSFLAQRTLQETFGLGNGDLVVVGMQRRFLEPGEPP